MPEDAPDFYAILGLHRGCTNAEIRAAYRVLAMQHHPDRHAGSAEAVARTQALNAAHDTLGDPRRRQAYDRDLAAAERPAPTSRLERNITQDAHLRLDEFLRGARLDVRVSDPGNPGGAESYELVIPDGTAPGARFRVPRDNGGFVIVRARAWPDARFKPRGSDLRCDLRISSQRAAEGGAESLRALGGGQVRVEIPRGAARGETVRVAGEGLPKPRGGRGDLLVRITYRPEVRITRSR